ncbi:uncharacterized protein J7T54_001204 [Emericellopsis cladophorae]|uniref:Uncharacterized protein n=1 Tax=Emericellopsis cladophorae TaxID=2686198 RepID=A0A9P9XZS7_9HYPO|nr:uncharacterized protein J7T54_001204 [Emericellopsis cladophorae]KAI6780700.1 hypothetical protein J7T54_001204 [Emericellopsis cladophorae]
MTAFSSIVVDALPPVVDDENGMRVASGDTYMGDSSPESAGPMRLDHQEGFMVAPRIMASSNSLWDEYVQHAQFTGQTQIDAQQPGSMSIMPIQAPNSVMASIPNSLLFPQATGQQPQHQIFLNTGSGHFEASHPVFWYKQFMQHRQGPSAANAAQPIPTATVPVVAPKPPVRSNVTHGFSKAYQNLKEGKVFFEDGRLCVFAGAASEISTGKAYVVDKFVGDTVHFVKNLKDVKTMGFLAFPVFTEPRELLESQGLQPDHKTMYELMVYNESSPIPAGEIIPGL